MPTPVPAKIGKYDIIRLIGRGGMGVVYEASDPHLGRRVAIKMITSVFAENPDMLKRFSREAQSIACLQHSNIVTLYDLGAHEGNPYLVMEYLDGESLESAQSSRRPLSLLDKMSIVIQVCRGLAYVHGRGVIHRDIKPANIMLCKDGGIKIFDFGIARAGDQNVTRTGEVIGTLQYMAPEQVNSRSVDFRADIYATGVVLYQLLTNHLPFEGHNTATTILKIVQEPPPPISTFLTTYPPEIEKVLERALAKNPNDRYASADDFAFDLEDLLGPLKEELVGREMQAAASSLEQGQVYEAQGTLQRLLRIDPQNGSAIRLLREVQQRIQRAEIGNQVHDLRGLAEMALEAEHFEEAQDYADRALGLDRSDTSLLELRKKVAAASSRAKKLHEALERAQAAQAEGNLEAALRAAEEALELAPDNSQARTLHRLISRQIGERSRRDQIEGLLQQARQRISARTFTAALEILKQAEELDPDSPQVQSLAASAAAGQENERRRRELDVLVREIEEALDHDDFRRASEKAGEAAFRFPEDQKLLQLKALADRQREFAERRQSVAGLPAVDDSVSAPTAPASSAEGAADALTPEKLQIIERQLASFMGPLARVLVKRAAAKTSNTSALYEMLAADLERDEDRKAFLAKRAEAQGGQAHVPTSRPVAAEAAPKPVPQPAGPAREEITPAAVELAAHFLAAHLGPIATVLARKEAQRAASLRDLYEHLAEHVADLAERERFLKVAGVQSGFRR
jgi:tetratricopeptide (TPR) repeat protein